jgi:TolA-binding protein
VSLLLKALKQAETGHAEKTVATDHALELESLTAADPAKAREWLEPPGMLLGSSGLTPSSSRPGRRLTMPQFSLVPATVLLAAAVAIGYGIYLYFALQSPHAPTKPPTLVASVASAPIVAVAPAPQQDAVTVSDPAVSIALPGPKMSTPASIRMHSPTITLAETRVPLRPLRTPRLDHAARSEYATSPLTPALSFKPDAASSLLNNAYDAYHNGQLDEAQRLYAQAAARERSVDALLGLAVIAGARNRDDDAVRLFREVLDRDPRNATAQAALLDLLGNTDKQVTESRLKTMIERAPSPNLYQTLGNLYAEQNRWSDAQTAYFEAYRATPGNADYAYNLAVSLDRLHQPQAALEYYEKALSLDGTHRFERAQAESRIRQIKAGPQ